jgi:hypothetical protein
VVVLTWKLTQQRPLRWSLCAPPAAICLNIASDGEEWVVTCLGETSRYSKRLELERVKPLAVDMFRGILRQLLEAQVQG